MSPAGRKPSLSAKVTMPSPTGGTKSNRPKTIATVVRRPSFELPGPESKTVKCRNEIHIIVILVNDFQYNHDL